MIYLFPKPIMENYLVTNGKNKAVKAAAVTATEADVFISILKSVIGIKFCHFFFFVELHK